MGFLSSLFGASTEGTQNSQEKKQSALGKGRMKETDSIKGKNSPLPSKNGIYQHINKKTGEVEYVGQTDNLRKRQQEHARAGKLDTETQKVRFAVAREGATKDDLLQTEKAHIKRNKPSGNKTEGGNGRR
ncbi:hypothetical protein BCS42_01875 [Crenothrix sp. D3]|nr:hypothetical protein BCS42_01875 [Crenothrix sp. D3]